MFHISADSPDELEALLEAVRDGTIGDLLDSRGYNVLDDRGFAIAGASRTETTFHGGGHQVTGHVGGGGGGSAFIMPPTSGGTGGAPYIPIEMPPCPVCGRPIPATGSPCRHGGAQVEGG